MQCAGDEALRCPFARTDTHASGAEERGSARAFCHPRVCARTELVPFSLPFTPQDSQLTYNLYTLEFQI